MKKLKFRLYQITDLSLFVTAGGMLRRLEQVLKYVRIYGGGKCSIAVCVRENDVTDRKLLSISMRVKELCRKYCAFVLINRRVDVAIAIGADGVHLGSKTIGIEAVKKIAPRMIIGYSAHDVNGAIKAFNSGADFVTISPIFPSPAEEGPAGIELLRRTVLACGGKPVFALGGITERNVPMVLRQGAWGVAFVKLGLASSRPSRQVKVLVNHFSVDRP